MAHKHSMNPLSESRPLAVITGASSGFGFEIAQVFAKNNFDLVVTDYNPAIVEAAEAFRAFGGLVEHIQTNLGAFKGVDGLIQKIESLHHPIDTVVFNAHVMTSGPFAEIPMEEELNAILVNVTSVVHLAKHVVKGMQKEHHGRLFFSTSLPLKNAETYHTVYESAKAFVHTFATGLRHELKDQGIIVTSMQPVAEGQSFSEYSLKLDAEAVAIQSFQAMMSGKNYVEDRIL